jgi:hypothetical protein
VGTTTIMDMSMHVKMFMGTSTHVSKSASMHTQMDTRTQMDMRTVTAMLME